MLVWSWRVVVLKGLAHRLQTNHWFLYLPASLELSLFQVCVDKHNTPHESCKLFVLCSVLLRLTYFGLVSYIRVVGNKAHIPKWIMCALHCPCYHDDVIKWKHFPRYWPFVQGIHQSPVNSPHKGQWHGASVFSLICAWTNGWVSNRDTGDLRRHHAHYDVPVIFALAVGGNRRKHLRPRWFNTSRLRLNAGHFADDVFKRILSDENGSLWPNWQEANMGSDNGLVPTRRQDHLPTDLSILWASP